MGKWNNDATSKRVQTINIVRIDLFFGAIVSLS